MDVCHRYLETLGDAPKLAILNLGTSQQQQELMGGLLQFITDAPIPSKNNY